MVTTSPDWLIPGIDGGKREDPRPYPLSNHERQRRARAHTKTLPPHTPHRTSHTPRGRSSVCGEGALHRADLRPSLRAAGLNAGQRADDVECAARGIAAPTIRLRG